MIIGSQMDIPVPLCTGITLFLFVVMLYYLIRQKRRLRIAEKHWLAVLNASPFPIAVANLADRQIDFWTDHAKELFGHTPDTVAEWYDLAYPDPEYQAEVIKLWQPAVDKARRTGQATYGGEYNITCKSGEVLICEIYVTCHQQHLIVTFKDITKQKQLQASQEQAMISLNDAQQHLEQQIIKRTTMLHSALEAAKAGTFYFDVINNEVVWDKRSCIMFGTTEEQFDGTYEGWRTLLHPEDIDFTCLDVEKKLADPTIETMILEYRTNPEHGPIRYIRAHCHINRSPEGKPLMLYGLHLDITDDKNKEHQLKNAKAYAEESQAKLQALFDALQVGVVLVDTDGHIVQANAKSGEYLGITVSEHKSRKLNSNQWQIVRSDLSPMPIEEYPASRTLNNGEVVLGVEMGVFRPNGDLIWISASSSPYRTEYGGGAVVVFQNITKQKAIEVELQQAKAKAEDANRAKSEFLANMSHEIRTPMNSVLGFTEILKGVEQDPKKSRYINNIHTSGKALLNLINDILDLSKIEAGKLELQYTTTSLESLFEEIQTFFQQKINDKGLGLIVEFDSTIPANLKLDGIRLRQIIINLVDNATKFTSSGHIRLSASAKESDSRNRVWIIIEVEDSGIGIPKDQQDKIFGAFEQTRGQKSSQFGGTGLGLAITSRLVEMMGGTISVSSEPNQGSTFRIELPDIETASAETVAEKLD